MELPRDAVRCTRQDILGVMTIVAMLFLLGTVSLTVASIARGSMEVLTATALIGVGIPFFLVAEKLRDRRLEHVTVAQCPTANPFR